METIIAAGLNNEALQLDDAGDYAGAERKHLEALRLKIQGNGEHSIQVALTKNGLGELYLKMGELDKAQNMLEGADAIRSGMPFSEP
jgi:tetratricopeptide (TPR) repeat protein